MYHYERQPGHAGELESRVPGLDPVKGRSYWTYATFRDPDGNGWFLQEITTRLPGREWQPDVASQAGLLRETAEHHGKFEAVAPPHDWWDWYAAYMSARETGSTPEDAAADAGRYMAEVKHVVVRPLDARTFTARQQRAGAVNASRDWRPAAHTTVPTRGRHRPQCG